MQPVLAPSTLVAAKWNEQSIASDRGDHRWDLFYAALADAKRALPRRYPQTIFVVAPYSGKSELYWLGAGALDGFAILPPRATSVLCRSDREMTVTQADATYATARELSFVHDALKSPWVVREGVGGVAKPKAVAELMRAILVSGEVKLLESSGYFARRLIRKRPARKT